MKPTLYRMIFSLFVLVLLVGCAVPVPGNSGGEVALPTPAPVKPLVISAIPDQDPELLLRLFGQVSDYLSAELGVPVQYKVVTDYTASVTAFRVGDLDLVWYGGLTGVQARLQVPGAQAIAQRDIDNQFHSVFIASTASGIEPFEEVEGLRQLIGRRFAFASESSTSGRLMPQYYLGQAGVSLSDFLGEAGFTGAHDKAIALVEAGSYDVAAINEQVWEARVASGEVDLDKVQLIWRTPPYVNYHWVIHPAVEERYGAGFSARVQDALLKLDSNNPDHKAILDLFGAGSFIETINENYDPVESVGREIGLIVD
jgi:phosphonate transport system substrate-binding protein